MVSFKDDSIIIYYDKLYILCNFNFKYVDTCQVGFFLFLLEKYMYDLNIKISFIDDFLNV